jgi:hypothetical protein
MRYLLLPLLVLSSCRQDKNTAEEAQSNEPTIVRPRKRAPTHGDAL